MAVSHPTGSLQTTQGIEDSFWMIRTPLGLSVQRIFITSFGVNVWLKPFWRDATVTQTRLRLVSNGRYPKSAAETTYTYVYYKHLLYEVDAVSNREARQCISNFKFQLRRRALGCGRESYRTNQRRHATEAYWEVDYQFRPFRIDAVAYSTRPTRNRQ